MGIHLKIPRKSESIIGGIATRVALHEESLEAGLRIPILLAMSDLLQRYNLCPVQLVSNAWRAIIGFFSLMVYHRMKPRAKVFHYFFHVKASQGWYYISPCKEFSFLASLAKLQGWKSWLFFMASPSSWLFPGCWDEVEPSWLLDPLMLLESKQIMLDELSLIQVPPYNILLLESWLKALYATKFLYPKIDSRQLFGEQSLVYFLF